MRARLFFIPALILLAVQAVFNQQEQNILEKYYEDFAKDNLSSGQLEIISYYRENKLNLAMCDPDELSLMPGFDDDVARKIVDFVYDAKPPGILALIDSLDLTHEQEIMLEYCTTIDYTGIKRYSLLVKNRNSTDFQKTKGISSGYYTGSPINSHSSMRFNAGDWGGGFTIGKSEGEKSFTDFAGGYASFRLMGWRVIAGDYNLMAGCGALFGSDFQTRKGADANAPLGLTKNAVAGNGSETDGSSLRGAVVGKRWLFSFNKFLSLKLFYSDRKMSGTVDTLGNVSSINRDGFFRNEKELSKKGVLNERIAGISSEYSFGTISIGINGYWIDYSREIVTESAREFSGKTGILSSIFASYSIKHFSLGLEAARDSKGNPAFTLAGSKSFDKNKSLLFQFRAFHQDYRSPYGAMFGEQSNPSNELGFYIGYANKLEENGYNSIYIDAYKSFIRTYFCPEPIRGMDIFGEAGRMIGDKLFFTARLKAEAKKDALTNENNDKVVTTKSRISMRLSLTNMSIVGFTTDFRLEGAYINYAGAANNLTGASAIINLNYQISDIIRIGGKLSIFSTGDYESAVWQFEYISPGYVSTTALFGNGSRLVFFADFDFGPVDIIFRYAMMSKNGVKSIQSGYDEISGNTSSSGLIAISLKLSGQ